MVKPDEKFRDNLYKFAQMNGNQALHDRLRKLNPKRADEIHPNNLKRVVRAIEVLSSNSKSGQFSEFERQQSRVTTLKMGANRNAICSMSGLTKELIK